MHTQWFKGGQLSPGTVLFEWDRPFSVWGYSGSHSRLLFRSAKYDWTMDRDWDDGGDSPEPKWAATRVDVLFKAVDALYLHRLSLPSLLVRVATQEVAEEVLHRAPSRHHRDVLELVGPDGAVDHVVCLGAGCCEDDGEYWEPSAFVDDLSDGVRPAWLLSILGGGPDGELTARYASAEDLVAAIRTDPPPAAMREKGRWLYVVLMRSLDRGDDRPGALAAYLTRHEAEQRAMELNARRDLGHAKYWVDAVLIEL